MELPLKVLLYCEDTDLISTSRPSIAFENQRKALDFANIEYTLNPRENYDILHINTVALTSSIIIDEARKKGAKIIYHAHTTEEDYRNSYLFSNITSSAQKRRMLALYSRADAIITPTPHSKKLLQSYGITKPIYVVSSGVEIEEFSENKEREKAFREKFGLHDDEQVVVSTGAWIQRKGILDFIKIAREFPNVKFIWFGKAPLATIPTEIRMAVLKNHPKNVVFAGYVTGDVYYGAFSAASAFVFPSYEETEGLAISEAMASKTPILVRDIPSYEGWLKNGENCFMNSNNADFIRNLRLVLLGQTPNLCECAYESAQKCAIPNIGEKLNKIYRNVLGDDTVQKIREYIAQKQDKKLSIGLFSDTYPPDVNGVAISVFTLKKQLEKMGHTVYVITPTIDTKLHGVEFEDGILRMPAIKLKQLYNYRLSRPYSIKALEYVREMKLDVCHLNTEFTSRMFGLWVASLYDLPIVATYHTMHEDYTHYFTPDSLENVSKKIVGWYTKIFFEKKGDVIVPSKKTADTLKRYGITKHMYIVPTGIDTSRFSPKNVNTQRVEQIKEEFGLKDKFVLSYVGRIASEKGVDVVLKALPPLLNENENMKMFVVGYGPSLEELKELVKTLGIADKVVFSGKVPPSEIQNYYAAADVFMTASTSETQGITYIEAMGSGLPVMAKYDKCIDDIVLPGKTGYFFDTNEDLLNAIKTYYNMTPEEKTAMKQNCIDKADEFSLEKFGTNILKVYYQAIAHNSRILERKKLKKQNKTDYQRIVKNERLVKYKRK